MHDFGAVNLSGKQGVFKANTFYLPGASVKDRTFICEGGSGCIPDTGTNRKIVGRWLSDSKPDTISSYDLECLLNDDGSKTKPKVTTTMEEPEKESQGPLDAPQKSVRRKR